jgi:hypothetical protein
VRGEHQRDLVARLRESGEVLEGLLRRRRDPDLIGAAVTVTQLPFDLFEGGGVAFDG